MDRMMENDAIAMPLEKRGFQIDSSYPDDSRAERISDGVVHVVGVSMAVLGIALLFLFWALPMDSRMLPAIIIYSITLIFMLVASAAYHMAARTPMRPILRRLDHAAIYLKIAGTFTPLSMFLGTAFSYFVLGLVWILALVGAMAKLMAERGKMTTGWLPYVALGCLGTVLFIPLSTILPSTSLALMLTGGLLYVAGVLFYCSKSLRYANAIWHSFVVMASACSFFGITSALAAGM